MSSSMLGSGIRHIPASILNVKIYCLLPLPSPPSNLVEWLRRRKNIASPSLKPLLWLRAPVGQESLISEECNSKAQVCCFLGFRNRDIRGTSNDYVLGELKGMMPKGRKELYTLELSGCISTTKTIGSSYSYLSLTLISYSALHSKCSFTVTVCSSEAPSHTSLSNLLVPNTNSPQSFKSSDSAIYGVMLKTQTVKCSSLKKWERGLFVFKAMFCRFYSRVAQIVMSLRGQWAAAQVAENLCTGGAACGT